MSERLDSAEAESMIKAKIKKARRLTTTVLASTLLFGSVNAVKTAPSYKFLKTVGNLGSVVGGSLAVASNRRRLRRYCDDIVLRSQPDADVQIVSLGERSNERADQRREPSYMWGATPTLYLGSLTMAMTFENDPKVEHVAQLAGLSVGAGLIYGAHHLYTKSFDRLNTIEEAYINKLTPDYADVQVPPNHSW